MSLACVMILLLASDKTRLIPIKYLQQCIILGQYDCLVQLILSFKKNKGSAYYYFSMGGDKRNIRKLQYEAKISSQLQLSKTEVYCVSGYIQHDNLKHSSGRDTTWKRD